MAYLELEEIIHNLEREFEKEKGLKNRCLFESAIKALKELKDRKNRI